MKKAASMDLFRSVATAFLASSSNVLIRIFNGKLLSIALNEQDGPGNVSSVACFTPQFTAAINIHKPRL